MLQASAYICNAAAAAVYQGQQQFEIGTTLGAFPGLSLSLNLTNLTTTNLASSHWTLLKVYIHKCTNFFKILCST